MNPKLWHMTHHFDDLYTHLRRPFSHLLIGLKIYQLCRISEIICCLFNIVTKTAASTNELILIRRKEKTFSTFSNIYRENRPHRPHDIVYCTCYVNSLAIPKAQRAGGCVEMSRLPGSMYLALIMIRDTTPLALTCVLQFTLPCFCFLIFYHLCCLIYLMSASIELSMFCLKNARGYEIGLGSLEHSATA